MSTASTTSALITAAPPLVPLTLLLLHLAVRRQRYSPRVVIALFIATLIAAALAPLTAHAQERPQGPQLTRAPELVQFVEAEYPPEAREAGTEATVTLQITIDATGAVSEALVIESAGEAFDAAAIAAARQFRFTPAEVDGAPAAIRISYAYRFTLEEEAPPPPTTGTLTGIVRDRRSRAPIAGVTIAIENGPSSTTDTEGRFELPDLAPGPVVLSLSGERLTALRTEETITAGERLEVAYDVTLRDPEDEQSEEDADDLEIVVVAPALRREVVSTRVEAEEARRVPGTGGDVLRVVESLPGVARSSVGTGQLVVWGASPEDTRVYVDGVRIPRLYHEGGLRSVIASDLVESLDLVPGGYGAAYGRGLGGIVTVRTLTPLGDGVHGTVSADLYDVSTTLRGSAGDRWRAAGAARVSWLHLFVEATQGDLGDYVAVPRYWDTQLRAAHQVRPGETIELVHMLGGDRISRGVPSSDPALATSESRELDFQRLYARWDRDGGDGSRSTIVPWVGWDRSLRASRFGDVTTSVASETWLLGLRASHRVRAFDLPDFGLDVEVGVDAELDVVGLSRQGSIGLPAREGDVRVFGQPPPDRIASDAWEVVQVGAAPYVEGDLAFFGGSLHVVPGLRIDPYARTVSRRSPREGDAPDIGLALQDFRAEPRLALRWDPYPFLGFRAAGGLYHQSAVPEDLSATFGNPTLPVAQAWHVLAGTTVRPIPTLGIEVTGFASFSEGLAVRSQIDSPLRAQALVAEGWGRAYGVQTLVRLEETEGFSGWVAYTLMRSERQDAAGQPWRLFDYDQTHVLTALLSWTPGGGFEVGARFRYSTGFPRTPVVDAFYDAGRDRWQPLFGERSSIRLPEFVQLDLRVGQRLELGDTRLEIWLEVQNVTNQANAEEFVFSPDYTRRDTVRGLPILPVLGLRWTF
ncbi:TonB family protein / TonB-dependent receptor [Sandaracinus amylolyticus]|nr:TonB family protein / TonB-dependent receptor [Sandaracinus amylolyticus]